MSEQLLWMQMKVFSVGLQNFFGQDDAQWCRETFVNEWRQGNAG